MTPLLFPAGPALRMIRRGVLLLAVLLLGACASGAGTADDESPRPYDEKVDPRADIAASLADNPARKRILLTFGANWCSDSRSLEARYRSPVLAPLLAREFRVVHIDVGMSHRNLDVVEQYGNPIDEGIPSVVLLDADGRTLFVNHGALSSAERMSDSAVKRFFEGLAADHPAH